MGLLGMLLNKKDAEDISSELHHLSMQTIHESNLQLARMREKSRRHTDLMVEQTAILTAIKIQELNDKIAWLEEGIALRDARIDAHIDMAQKLLGTNNDPKIKQAYLYQYFRFEDQALDKLLASGELKRDPRQIKEWRDHRGYVPPEPTTDEQASDIATPPPLPPFEDLEATGELTKDHPQMKESRGNRGDVLPQPTANEQASGFATPPPLPPFQDLD
ncbi:MAG: hypothetical protein Q4A28_05700 [Brachymonas sp.]|nr:hypothetical protein [Brachymonas sp.]